MASTYRLLRDNKETGPYSQEELLQLSLKAFDLVWVEGQSAGWRYPSEIEILKPYMETTAQETNAPAIQQAETPRLEAGVRDISDVFVSNLNSEPATEHERVRAIESAPPVFSFEEPGAVKEEEEEVTAEKLEKKANEIYLRVQDYTKQKEQGLEGIETKHARSLDDLKQEYADWLHHSKQKKTSRISKKHIAVGAATVLVGAAVYFFVGSSGTTQEIPVHHTYYLSNAVEKPGDYKKQKSNRTELRSTSTATAKAGAPAAKELSIDEFLDSVKRELAKQDERLAMASAKSTYKKPHAVKTTGLITTPTTQSTTGVENIQPVKTQSIADLVALDAKYLVEPRRQNISSLEITIRNNSKELLKTVAVDVFYYKNGQRLFDKETFYINNVQPGNSFTLSTPGNKKAVSAKFQLGKIN